MQKWRHRNWRSGVIGNIRAGMPGAMTNLHAHGTQRSQQGEEAPTPLPSRPSMAPFPSTYRPPAVQAGNPARLPANEDTR